jgi:tRNA 5-methylaminomethyl-2-thiouridine biosynthesis bifunctional protein
VAEVDAFFLDGFAPAKNPAMWQRHVCKALGRIAARGASAATWSVARAVQDGLHEAGFGVEKARGLGDKREMTVARFAPRFTPRRPRGRTIAAQPPPCVAIVGGGLAGCALAWALSRQGIASRVFERRARPAEETSGNAGGIFHGIVTPHDGPHARFNRAAALASTPFVERALREHAVAGSAQGLLRLHDASDSGAMRSMLDALGLPGGYVQALDAKQASEHAGLPLGERTAWFYPGGGFVDPRGLAAALLALAGDATTWCGSTAVAALRREGDRWRLLDATGASLDVAEAVALCGNADALALLPDESARWPLQRLRGQTTGVPASALGGFVPRLPIAGFGYVLPPIDGTVWCGATRDADDAAHELRASDHARNLEQLARVVGRRIDGLPLDALQGRVGWRLVADDRLPLIGAVPDARALALGQRLDQPRFVPREPGLCVFTALASRGLTWAVLGAQTLAARIAGAPCPIEASLLDAVDAGRFAARAARRAATCQAGTCS